MLRYLCAPRYTKQKNFQEMSFFFAPSNKVSWLFSQQFAFLTAGVAFVCSEVSQSGVQRTLNLQNFTPAWCQKLLKTIPKSLLSSVIATDGFYFTSTPFSL